MSMFIVIAGLITVLWAQSISYHSAFCTSFLENNSSESMKPKYVKMVENLNNDTTLKAQIRRATKFIKNNWKDLYGIDRKFLVEPHIESARQRVESRRRIVDHLNKLLTELKPKIEKLLWDTDAAEKHDVANYHLHWRLNVLNMMSPETKRQEIIDFFTNWQTREDYKTFTMDLRCWYSPFISYDSVFCTSFLENYTPEAMWPKYQLVSPEARRQEIIDFFNEWEKRKDFTTFENNQMYWITAQGFLGCF
ncbi:hypothetical protein PRIPAC_86171 [Pristionchus pacificus]|uniref:Uncharacterized protein n=1 Tax=Pristionchus pacificus TaxID=54126 RepID=A0A2A6BUM9_PRIPA|nr:hypothetical protein PRIPAC_86171 [Pristionchus pacificus]|eukprot:PDM69513.1 hypothetical protein PRIPAC_44609 [Pristionchus pacificus]